MRGFVFCAALGVLLLQQGKSDGDHYYIGISDVLDDNYRERAVPSIIPPRLIRESFELTAKVGESVTFPCQVEVPDGAAVLWKKEDTTYGLVTNISNGDPDRFQIVKGTSLRISDVVPTDRGTYSCQITTEPEVASYHILKVTSRPSHGRPCAHKSEKWIDLGGDYCYLIEQENQVKWIQAVYKCFQEGGSLATIRSMEEVKRLQRYLNGADDDLYIGLWKHNDGSFEWVDKSTSDFRNWNEQEPNRRTETCVEILMESGKWNDADCSISSGYICSSLKSQTAPDSNKVCPNTSIEWHDYGGEYCYIIELNREITARSAAELCSSEGGTLASFHSIEEISVVREHIKHHHDRLHIGFWQNSDGTFEWTDRSPVDLIFWDFGEPNDIAEQCGEIYPSTGLWNDIPCSKRVGYICSTPKVEPGSSTTEAPPSTIATNCGGDIVAVSGTITSPNYPDNYSPNMNCVWKITVPETSQITLNFEVLQLEYGADCEFDHIQILDGNEPDSTVLRRFCGSGAGQIVASSGNKMSVKFSSDRVNQRQGFVAKFKTAEQCGGSIVAEEGVINSRRYPENYLANDVCKWKITVPENNVVRLRFKAFETESSGGCVNDYVEILDGHDTYSPILERYCGFEIPDEIRSSGHKMTITFVSDATKEYYGFSIEFTKVEVVPLQPTADGVLFPSTSPTEEDEVEDECQDAIDYDKGTLVSPRYPNNYRSYANCAWNIRASPGSTISLRFKTFSLEYSDACSFDYVAVYDGPEVSSTSLGKFCSEGVPGLITSSGNQMSVHFKTDSSVQSRGFTATFSTNQSNTEGIGDVKNEEGCGENILSDEGIIKSPRYPEFYGPHTECFWKITVPSGNQVVLKFTDFKVEGHVRCAYDYVLIRDGHSPRSRVLNKLCGSEIPSEIRSSGNQLMIEFKSDSSGEHIGFSAEFKKDPLAVVPTGIPSQESGLCGGYIHDTNGTIQSPNYPLPYGPLQNCTWKITAPEGNQIFMKFDSVELEYGPECKFDRVAVFDADDVESPGITAFCDDEQGRRYLSSENKITVQFTSDDSFELTGFKATYGKVLSCGGNITADKGIIESPNGTEGYACTWRITVPENFTVLLKVHVDPIPYDPERYFQMEIRHGPDQDSELKGLNSFLDENFTALSKTNEMFVLVTSYGSEELPHLHAEFEQYTCGGDISGDAGTFFSPNYPGKYRNNEDCTWRITVPENYHVLLSFRKFHLEYSSSCQYDFVEIREGHSPSGNILGRFCGNTSPVVSLSETNKISLRFVSDSSGEYEGFVAKFGKEISRKESPSTCNRYITADRGAISSPMYPDHYPGNQYCAWKIWVPDVNSVVLKFNAFDLESSDNCEFDYVSVFAGHGNPDSQPLGKFCGDDIPEEIHAPSNKITVVFESDSGITDAGFSAEFSGDYSSTDASDTCNRYITADSGTISSPMYPSRYPANQHCTWKIRVPEANAVVLKFNAFHLESNEMCSYDYVEVFDGHDYLSRRLLGKFCGASIPEVIHSTTDKITVCFVSDSSASFTGFSAEFSGVSYSELEDLLRQLPNMIFEQSKVKPKPSSGKQKKKKKPVMKRSLVQSLQKTFKLL